MACLVSVLILERISFSWTKEPMEPLLRCMEWTALFCSSSLTIKARTAAFYQSGLPVWQCWECPAGSCGPSATCLPSDCAGRTTNSRRRDLPSFSHAPHSSPPSSPPGASSSLRTASGTLTTAMCCLRLSRSSLPV